MLPPLSGGGGGDGGSCAVGHLVGAGQVYQAEEGTALVSFGIRGDSFVVGTITAEEVQDEQNPFQNLISGAGWLVRAGVNHVEASARDGHLDILLDHDDDGEGEEGGGSGSSSSSSAGDGEGGALDDLLVAKLARTAIGHDSEGRLILLQTSGAAAGSDQDTAIPDGLDLSELADVLVEAGAVNAINLVGGAPSAMMVNGSAIVDPAEPCSTLVEGKRRIGGGGDSDSYGGFADGSTLPRCEIPVSSIVCVHLDPPPLIEGAGGVDSTPSPTLQPASSSSSAAAVPGGDDWGGGGWDSSSGGGQSSGDNTEEVRLQWTRELCGGNSTGNATSLWEHLDDVEESVLRYKIAFWVAAVLGMASLYLNIQHQKSNSSSTSRSAELGGSAYSRQLQQQHVGLVNGGTVKTGTGPTSPTGIVEMVGRGGGSKRGSRSSRRKRGSSTGGGYARVNGGDGDWDEDGGLGGGGAHAAMMDSEEEVDLGLAPARMSSRSKRDKGKGGRLRKALAKVSRGGGGGGGGGDLDAAAMAINPFGGGGRGGARGGSGEVYDEEGTWA
ncbi:unnamed protein product [Ectocarpus fasciculatus]